MRSLSLTHSGMGFWSDFVHFLGLVLGERDSGMSDLDHRVVFSSGVEGLCIDLVGEVSVSQSRKEDGSRDDDLTFAMDPCRLVERVTYATGVSAREFREGDDDTGGEPRERFRFRVTSNRELVGADEYDDEGELPEEKRELLRRWDGRDQPGYVVRMIERLYPTGTMVSFVAELDPPVLIFCRISAKI